MKISQRVVFYHEVSSEELYQICAEELGDLERITGAYRRWLKANPEMIDTTL